MGERLRMCGKKRAENGGTVDWKKAPKLVSSIAEGLTYLPEQAAEERPRGPGKAQSGRKKRRQREGQRRCADSGDGAAQDG